MCSVSAITAYGQTVWPGNISAYQGVRPTPSPKEWAEFLELVDKARKFDELTNQPDCIDPGKEEWMREIEARIAKLEVG